MTWQRLEGLHIDPAVTEGISSAIADPLWLLARQWQVGEFRGEDAASPVLIEATIATAPIVEYWTEQGGVRHITSRIGKPWPLETLVEHEPIVEGPAQAGIRLEGGAALVRRLRAIGTPTALLDTLVRAYAFTDALDADFDPLGAARLALLAKRVPDGAAVVAAVDAAGGDPTKLPELATAPPGVAAAVAAVVSQWRAQEAALFCDAAPADPSAWSPSRLEYSFGVSAKVPTGHLDLTAPEYPGGTLDWFHFDVLPGADGAGPASPPGTVTGLATKTLTSLPTPLQFSGMPASRWWEFEDHDVDFGDLGAGPDDLARSVLAAYAMVAGEDWFGVPCELAAGSIAQVRTLRVLDDFGSSTPVGSTAARDAAAGGGRPWRFFELTGDTGPRDGDAPLLFLPPVVHAVEQGKPVELVDFRRDEMANLAWAIERRVESESGHPVDRDAPRDGGNRGGGVEVDDDALADAWRYQLSTDVPDHWVPLVPVRIDGSRPRIALRRGRIAAEPSDHLARGRILTPERSFVMHEEEIPVGGARVSRRYQLARGIDGSVRLWVGRRKTPGGGPLRRTPLRFDELATAQRVDGGGGSG